MPYVILYSHHIRLTHFCPFHFNPLPAGEALNTLRNDLPHTALQFFHQGISRFA
jgi:hypothetical protein